MANEVAYIGIDIGAAATKCSSKSGQILRNELGGVTTTTMLSFPARSWRLIGESAVASYAANAR
jgi:molecular chaperone DnaK (HSP70)